MNSVHEGIHFNCDQCDKELKLILEDINSDHEGIYFTCDQCDYKSTVGSYHNGHRKSLHEVGHYPCDH